MKSNTILLVAILIAVVVGVVAYLSENDYFGRSYSPLDYGLATEIYKQNRRNALGY